MPVQSRYTRNLHLDNISTEHRIRIAYRLKGAQFRAEGFNSMLGLKYFNSRAEILNSRAEGLIPGLKYSIPGLNVSILGLKSSIPG